MFTDPLGQFTFELPLGWGYNLARSHLITTVFTRADRQSESVSVRALPSFAPEASNQEWQNVAQKKALSQNKHPVRALGCGNKKALFCQGNDTDASNMQILLLQGKSMDILVQHFDPEYPAEDGPTEVMRSICRSLLIPSDYVEPEFSEQHLVNTALQAAQQAVMQEDWEQVSQAATQALAQARDTYLLSVTKGAFMPEVPAVLAVIDALIFLGQAKASMYHLRDAELLVHRAQHTLIELPHLRKDRKDELLIALDNRRQSIGKLQEGIMQLLDGFEKEEKASLVMQRAKFLLHNACIAGERLDYDSALSSANCAIEDMLMLVVSVLQAPEHLDQDKSLQIRETLSIAEGESDERQIQLTKRILNRFLLGEMVDALRVLGTLRAARGEDTGALRTSRLLATISRTLDRPEPTPTGYILPFSDHRRHLAAATLELIENELIASTRPDFENTRWKLDDVGMMLDELKEGGVLRAKHAYLKELTTAVENHDLPEGLDSEAVARKLIHQYISPEILQILADWALSAAPLLPGETHKSVHLPRSVLNGGPAAVIAYGIEHLPESDAVAFWQTTASTVQIEKANKADYYIKQWMESLDWRHGWAAAALRALDQHCPLSHWGVLTGMEYARACLVQPPVLTDYALKQATTDSVSAEASLFDEEPKMESSPFGDQTILKVLRALDFLVVAQEAQPARLTNVLMELETSEQQDMKLAWLALKQLQPGQLFRQTIQSEEVGSALSLLLRSRVEEAEHQGKPDKVGSLISPIIRIASRYGTTVDFLRATHLATAATARANPELQPELFNILGHLKLAADWCGDADFEATVEHARGLLLREFVGKAPGLTRAIAAFQRAVTLRDQLNETIEAAGSLIDMSALLIGYGNILVLLEEGSDWPNFANRYLMEAVQRLLSQDPNPVTLTYLGEAFQNRARMHISTGALSQAADDAVRSMGFARAIDFLDLENRAWETLKLATDEPEAYASKIKKLPDLLTDVKDCVEQEQDEIGRISNKTGSFNTILDMLFEQAGESIDVEKASELILKEIESSRGFTYNRWLQFAPVTHTKKLIHELQADTSHPVLAIFAVTTAGVALLVLDGEHPLQFFPIDTNVKELEALVETHLKGLLKQGRVKGKVPWRRFQTKFMENGWRLLAPLDPYVAEGRCICFVPHRVLHGAALHTLPTSIDGEPIGLRTPVFTNPSLTNWLAAKVNATKPAHQAFVGITCPESELAKFTEATAVAKTLADTGIEVQKPNPHHVDLDTLAAKGHAWQVLHLSSHGMFDETSREMGLLLSRNTALPPPPRQRVDDEVRRYLASPNDLRRAGMQARLSFLASCLSSRNQQYPGDDLMGVTRAFFSSGSADLIGGAWTVVSSVTHTFATRFYQVLVAGQPVAQAVFEARKAVAQTHPDPFYWGVFVHQGANSNPLHINGGKK